jgi:hypothetical protein
MRGVPEELAEQVRAAAARAGMNIGEYVTEVLAADQAAASGGEELRRARAHVHAAAAYKKWLGSGQSKEGSMDMGEVFGT